MWRSVGRVVARYSSANGTSIDALHDRQVRAFGEDGQRAIQSLRIAFVGAGGTGSVAIQQLAYLGVRQFLVIDPDTVDETNLNRLIGATRRDLGRPKVQIARRLIRHLNPDAEVLAVQGDVLDEQVGLKLLDADFVFNCTDTHGSRHFVNQLAYQYFIPVIDMGVVISVNDGTVTHFGGRAQMLGPGMGCLICRDGILSPDQVRWDLNNDAQRKADPYFLGQAGIKQPSVISLNSTVSSLAVTMFLAAVAGFPADVRSQLYRGMVGTVRALESEPIPNCINCSDQGFFGLGDSCALPVRAK